MDTTIDKVTGRVPVTIFRLSGSLDGSNYDELINAGIEAEATGTTDLLLDMRNLEFMSSAGMVGLQMLLRLMGGETSPRHAGAAAFRPAGPSGGAAGVAHMKLFGPTPDVDRVLETVGLKDFVQIYDNEIDAIASF